MNREESARIHLDWWGQCRTCKFWGGGREEEKRHEGGVCGNQESPLSGQTTYVTGKCKEWVSFDPEVAAKIEAESV